MLNDEFLDEKDKEIIKLKRTIEKFKEYDKERKAYYSKSMQRLGELESYVQELEQELRETETEKVARLKQKIENQKEQLSHLLTIKQVTKMPEEEVKENLTLVPEINNLRKRIKQLNERDKLARKTISELVYKLNQLQKENERN